MQTQAVNGIGKKSKKGTAVGRREGIYSIVVDRLDADLLRDSAKEASLAFGEDDSSQQIAVNLQALYKRQHAEKKTPLFQCEVSEGGCGADQPKDSGACPFCGFDPDAPQDTLSASEDDSSEVEDPGPLPEEPEEGGTATEPAPAFTEGANPDLVTDITDPEVVLGKDTTPVEPRKRGRPKGSKNLPKGREDVPGEMAPGGASTALAKVVPAEMIVKDDTTPASEVLTAKDLDDAEDAYFAANRATWLAWWHEGRALWEIFSKKLWLLRLDSATKAPKYKTFQQYVSDRYKLTPNYVFERMDAARAHTEVQASKLGMSNCVLLMKAPEEKKKEIEAKIHRGEITNPGQTRAAVAKANKEKGTVKTKGSKTGERKTGGGRKKEYVKLAIAEQLGKSTIAMLYTPDGDVKAEKIADMPAAVSKWIEKARPFCQHESLDGEVVESFGLSVKDGKLSLVIHRSRPSDDAE